MKIIVNDDKFLFVGMSIIPEFNEIGENMRFDDFVWTREPDKYVVDGNPVALNHNNICVNIWWCN